MIRVLDKSVANKIAAGEVIERPVSIVKELVENSIDAESKNITVEIKQGGREYIRVTDDGIGIPSEEVLTAFLRHATSKIIKADDLRSLKTLGFRGEALASIAAVSRVELVTKTKDKELGKRIIIHGGEVIDQSSLGCPDGTTLIVTDLFYNTPARSKFLKSDGAESGQIIDFMEKIVLTRPDISFRLINNGKIVFSTAGKGDLLSSIISVYKDREYSQLINLDYNKNGIKVYGYISRPQITRTNKRSQFFFVNGRVIKNGLMEKALMSGYKERLFEGRYPIAFLFVEVDPGKLDVNIHPNKKEVRFSDEISVSTAIRDAVVEALVGDRAISHTEYQQPVKEVKRDSRDIEEYNVSQNQEKIISIYEDSEKKDDGYSVDINSLFSLKRDKEENIKIVNDNILSEYNMGNKPFNFDDLFFMDTIFDTYIQAVDEDNFYLFDQHACHERINYELFLKNFNSEERPRQIVLLPFTLDVPSSMALNDEEWLESIEKLGFLPEKFGENTYIFREVPQFLTLEEAKSFAEEFIDAYYEGQSLSKTPDLDRLISRACKASIKANDHINKDEIDALILQLKSCNNPFSCPHGRPTFVKFSKKEIEKMFKRIL